MVYLTKHRVPTTVVVKKTYDTQKVFEIKLAMHHTGGKSRRKRPDNPDWLPPRSIKLLDQVRERVYYLRYGLQTEKASACWAKAFVL